MSAPAKKLVNAVAKIGTGKQLRREYIRSVINAPLTKEERALEAKQAGKLHKKSFKWSRDKMEAAVLVAEDRLPTVAICKTLGVSEQELGHWLRNEEFQTKVTELQDKLATEIMNRGLAKKLNRIASLDEIHRGLTQIIYERRQKYKNRKRPGVSTGLMKLTVKAVGAGKHARVYREWELDKDLIDLHKDISFQAAKELGQLTEKTHNTNETIIREYKGVSEDDL